MKAKKQISDRHASIMRLAGFDVRQFEGVAFKSGNERHPGGEWNAAIRRQGAVYMAECISSAVRPRHAVEARIPVRCLDSQILSLCDLLTLNTAEGYK